jgi:hypothetical protein
MTRWLNNKTLIVAGLILATSALGASCSSDPATSTTEGGGGSTSPSTTSQGSGTTTSGSTSQSSTTGGMGGEGGGMGCGDTMTDVNNCGACGNTCALGQTCEAGACMCGVGADAPFADVQAIFSKSCGGAGFCHNKNNPAGGLDLRPGASHAELVGVDTSYCKDGRKRVEAGQPSESYIIDKVINTQLCDLPNGPSSKMPPGMSPMLPMGDIQTISNWICGGAKP